MVKKQGFEWRSRYSTTDELDKHGRWARICYHNGVMIAWVTMLTIGKDKIFQTTDYFPSQSGDLPCYLGTYRNCEIEKVKLATEKRFLKFLERVKK